MVPIAVGVRGRTAGGDDADCTTAPIVGPNVPFYDFYPLQNQGSRRGEFDGYQPLRVGVAGYEGFAFDEGVLFLAVPDEYHVAAGGVTVARYDRILRGRETGEGRGRRVAYQPFFYEIGREPIARHTIQLHAVRYPSSGIPHRDGAIALARTGRGQRAYQIRLQRRYRPELGLLHVEYSGITVLFAAYPDPVVVGKHIQIYANAVSAGRTEIVPRRPHHIDVQRGIGSSPVQGEFVRLPEGVPTDEGAGNQEGEQRGIASAVFLGNIVGKNPEGAGIFHHDGFGQFAVGYDVPGGYPIGSRPEVAEQRVALGEGTSPRQRHPVAKVAAGGLGADDGVSTAPAGDARGKQGEGELLRLVERHRQFGGAALRVADEQSIHTGGKSGHHPAIAGYRLRRCRCRVRDRVRRAASGNRQRSAPCRRVATNGIGRSGDRDRERGRIRSYRKGVPGRTLGVFVDKGNVVVSGLQGKGVGLIG